MLDRYPDSATANSVTCDLHGVKGCATCNKVEGDCDFGSCCAPATMTVTAIRRDGSVAEVRPACGDHAQRMTSAPRASGLLVKVAVAR
jgi:hypothetical protein